MRTPDQCRVCDCCERSGPRPRGMQVDRRSCGGPARPGRRKRRTDRGPPAWSPCGATVSIITSIWNTPLRQSRAGYPAAPHGRSLRSRGGKHRQDRERRKKGRHGCPSPFLPLFTARSLKLVLTDPVLVAGRSSVCWRQTAFVHIEAMRSAKKSSGSRLDRARESIPA